MARHLDWRPLLREHCRVCPVSEDSRLQPILDLGSIPLVGFPETPHTERPRVPLELAICPACTLVQLKHTTDPDLLYREYWYRSGVNERMVEELGEIANQGCLWVGPKKGDRVLDIGANDGTLLAEFPPGIFRTAYEPARNLQDYLWPFADLLVPDYFPNDTTWDEIDHGIQYRLIFSIACFYDLDQPLRSCYAVKRLLQPDGLWILQFQDLLGMIHTGAFDNICHEHLEYYSLYSLSQTLAHEALTILDVQPSSINGGSLRVFVGHRGQEGKPGAAERVCDQIDKEYAAGLCGGTAANWTTYFRHRAQVALARTNVILAQTTAQGGTVDLYGASTKGHTLLHLGVNYGLIRQAIERSPEKIGRYVGGTAIPIVSEEVGRTNPASLWVVPIWQFRDQVIAREQEYLSRGGTLYFPLPDGEIVRGSHV